MSKLSAVITGNINNIRRTDAYVEAKAQQRLKICEVCPAFRYSTRFKHNVCSSNARVIHAEKGVKVKGCGCPINAKIRQDEEPCPAAKW